jgi:cytochrome P450
MPDPLSLANLARPELRRDPYPFYAKLRGEAPVHFDAESQSWVLTRYHDVMAVLHDRGTSRTKALERMFTRLPETLQMRAAPIRNFFAQMQIYADPPDHSRLRGLVSKAFTPKMVEKLQPLVEQTANELAASAVSKRSFDFIEDFAYPFPLIIVTRLLGVDVEHQKQFHEWSNTAMAVLGLQTSEPATIDAAVRAIDDLSGYIETLANRVRHHPDGSLMSALVAAADAGDRLSPSALVANTVMWMIGGHEPTMNMIANGLVALLRHPAVLAEVRANPTLREAAVTELIRYDGPVHMTTRVALADVQVGGNTIPAGSLITLCLAAANRDPDAFPRPDELDLHRPELKEASFGAGIHYCLGAPLARIELPVALTTLLRHIPKLTVDLDALEWHDNPVYRGPKTFPVRVG